MNETQGILKETDKKTRMRKHDPPRAKPYDLHDCQSYTYKPWFFQNAYPSSGRYQEHVQHVSPTPLESGMPMLAELVQLTQAWMISRALPSRSAAFSASRDVYCPTESEGRRSTFGFVRTAPPTSRRTRVMMLMVMTVVMMMMIKLVTIMTMSFMMMVMMRILVYCNDDLDGADASHGDDHSDEYDDEKPAWSCSYPRSCS